MSTTVAFAPGSPSDLVYQIGSALTDALNILARLSTAVRIDTAPTPAVVLPLRRKAVQAPVKAPVTLAPVPITSWMTPTKAPRTIEPKAKQVRRQGAAGRIVAAVLSPRGVLANELYDIAGYPCGPTVLNRLAASHGFTWREEGEGAQRRFIGNTPKQVRHR